MYTELILGCELKADLPQDVVATLQYLFGEIDEIPPNYPFPQDSIRYQSFFHSTSAYFPKTPDSSEMRFRYGNFVLNARCNLKNYDGEIERVLEWLKPYISSGSGAREMYAIVIYEESPEPTIYYLREDYK